MKLEIEVKRRRFSVTQGQADVYVNGEMVISFGDTIEIINDGQPYYSEKLVIGRVSFRILSLSEGCCSIHTTMCTTTAKK